MENSSLGVSADFLAGVTHKMASLSVSPNLRSLLGLLRGGKAGLDFGSEFKAYHCAITVM